ncbi:hypothetical protein GCM10010172_81190 [Paractinoplanes ferrugineus]|uniref:DUF4352 domain-containing protein n=1 Tax=Paractinoplanes ferrugineus TaxID=113564 RepID=A0A919MFC8_9ACTN|nr:DUF4352 domain-containing protein [Actinoplanes ferrugineus]GIE10440.1 hypothetical protein Afe05nite_22800 [Actinoplanes ferrugineus]
MRRAWLTLSAVTVLLGGCSDAAPPVPDRTVKTGTMGAAVTREGIFEYTVGSVDCAGSAPRLCTVGLTVHNLSGTPRKPGISFAKLYDARGTAYLADALAQIRGDTRLLDDLAAGAAVADRLYYDVPADATISKLELREEPSSPGITIDVPGRRNT